MQIILQRLQAKNVFLDDFHALQFGYSQLTHRHMCHIFPDIGCFHVQHWTVLLLLVP